jgi:glycerophosphoryl diester phosphodiesterase
VADNNSVIFIHPDGTSPSHYALARYATKGPDGRLNWDMMDTAGVYLSHIKDGLAPSSNAGAVVHAYGVKPQTDSYGLDEEGNPIVSVSAQEGLTEPGTTIMEEAIAQGKATAVINSGFIAEPGTGVFLADVPSRDDTEDITAEILTSGTNVILGGGETDYLPEGTVGFFGEEGTRSDGRNLIEEAQAMGYSVVYTTEQLQSLPQGTEKVLGIFAAEDSYNDTTEEANATERLGNYGQPGNENPPTVAQMLEAALPIINQDPDGFMVVLEEEGTDNFSNNNNGRGTLDAAIRADNAIGAAMDFINNEDPNTLLVTSADSNAAGLLPVDVDADETVGTSPVNPTLADESDAVEIPLDGAEGRGTKPFVAQPDANGTEFPFGITYAGLTDFPDGVVSKTYGLNAEDMPSSHENTYLYELMYRTLFGQNSLPNLIDGTPESETLLGGTDRDLIRANEGDDTLAGSVNNDILYGEVGNDLLRGDLNIPGDGGEAGGDDLLYGGLGSDRVFGQGGDDRLYGSEDNDRLFGDAGRDVLVGGMGLDTLTGGSGRDILAIAPESGTDTFSDFRVGEDFIVLMDGLTFENLTIAQDGNNTVIGSSNETNLAILTGINSNDLIVAADSTFISSSFA